MVREEKESCDLREESESRVSSCTRKERYARRGRLLALEVSKAARRCEAREACEARKFVRSGRACDNLCVCVLRLHLQLNRVAL
jgi:hypothetical protein